MKLLSMRVGWVAVTLVFAMAIGACKKRGEAVKSDLNEAGYQLTTEDWFRANREKDVAVLKKFLAAGFPMDRRNEGGDSALHAAATAGAQAAADFLLDQKLAVDLRGADERTPLMAAVIADQKEMVRWLLRQGADPHLKDKDGFQPLMLAVREGRSNAVAELAAYDRENLDSALLLAALVGRADVIDSLTNFGASVYAKMEDGRTPLMIAAENGHIEATRLLLDIGASRFTTDPDGRTAADLATAAGHIEVAALINREPLPTELALDLPEKIAASMDESVDVAVAKSDVTKPRGDVASRMPARSINGAVTSGRITSEVPVRKQEAPFAMPPLVMRHYREKEIPIRVKSVQGDTATIRLYGTTAMEMKVRAGDQIPGSSLVVVRVQRRMEDSKVSLGEPAEISVMEVRDISSGQKREWIAGISSNAHDPVALVEDAATGQRYAASPGQKFRGADGEEYLISEVRPNQMVIQEVASGAVQTIPLRGPRG